MNNLDEQDIDEWLIYMENKKVSGSKAYNKKPEELENLSSSSIDKAASHLNICFQYAKKRKWMSEELNVDKIHVTYKNTPYWTAKEFTENISKLNNPLLQFFIHLMFILSGRPGEPAGLQMDSINLNERWIHIRQSLTRAKIDRIEKTDPKKVLFMFPKAKEDSESVLFLKCTKTEKSDRIVMITDQLMSEVMQRIEQINACKRYFGENYHDYNLLICQDNGNPYDPRMLQKLFKKCQVKAGIENIITLRGIRKSSLIYKTNITGNDYTMVMKDSGHTQVQTLIKHYDDVTSDERLKFADKIQKDLYQPQEQKQAPEMSDELYNTLIEKILSNPEHLQLFLMKLAPQPA